MLNYQSNTSQNGSYPIMEMKHHFLLTIFELHWLIQFTSWLTEPLIIPWQRKAEKVFIRFMIIDFVPLFKCQYTATHLKFVILENMLLRKKLDISKHTSAAVSDFLTKELSYLGLKLQCKNTLIMLISSRCMHEQLDTANFNLWKWSEFLWGRRRGVGYCSGELREVFGTDLPR